MTIRTAIVLAVLTTTPLVRADTWTNSLGRAFSACLIALDDREGTFVFTEDGATNRLALASLSSACRERARDQFDLPEIPPALAATWAQAKRSLLATKGLAADGRLSDDDAALRRRQVDSALRNACRELRLPEDRIRALLRRFAREQTDQ